MGRLRPVMRTSDSPPEPEAIDARRRRARPVRPPRLARGIVAALLVTAAGLLVPANGGSSAFADSYTASQDNQRTGWVQSEPNLGPSTVTGSNFGQLFATQLNGQIYAQPLVIGSTVVASTENDWVYGLDAVTGAIKWSQNFGPAWPASVSGCADLQPNLGNTSTGVYDPSTNVVYLTTKVNDGPDAQNPNWYLHAVNVTTGAERAGWPVKIVGTPTNDPAHPFRARDVNQRPGLLLLDGAIYLGFGGQCDFGSYVGWVVGVNTTSQAMNLWSDEVGASSQLAGIWHAGSGLVSDGPGRIFVATGNGATPPDSPGSPTPQQLSQSLIRLSVAANGTISSQDFFSPSNAAVLDANDQDFGAGGPVALPDQYFGTPATPHLMVQIGKDGRLFLLNRDHLGGKGQGPGGTDAVLQILGPYNGVWGHAAVYGGQGGYVYVVQSYGTMLAFKYGTNGSGAPALTLAGNTAETFGYTAGSPIVTSNGTAAGSAVVWVVNVDGPTGTNGRLCAYDAMPSNNRVSLLRCFPIGTASKFVVPAASNGRVYVGQRDGFLYGFGQPATAALTAPQTAFGNVNVLGTGTATVVATATRPITVTGVSVAAPFAVTAPTLPVTLAAGQTISVPVRFNPTAPGSFTGALLFAVTDAGTSASYGAALQGTAIKPGFTASPADQDYGGIAIGAAKALTVSFTNTGTANEVISAVTGPTGPFTTTSLPTVGTVVTPGQVIATSVTYTPTTVGAQTTTISVTGPNGTSTATLHGTGVTGVAELTIQPAALNFGSVPIGLSATQTLTVSNTGNLDVQITKAAPPALPFVVNTPLPEGLVMGAGAVVQIQVTFTPTVAGTYNNVYVISSNDGHGAHNVPVTATAVNPPSGTPVPSIVGGGWVVNGSATAVGAGLVLTPATSQQNGSAVFSTPLPNEGLRASFTAQIDGGNGADGLTFAMLDASRNTAQSLGSGGGGLGFSGLPGVAVTLDTYQGGNDPSSNFIGLSTGGTNDTLTYVATATNIPNLRTGTHQIAVAATGGVVTVAIDGTQVISAPVTLPPSVLAAFTGSTGGANDRHAVTNVSVSSGSTVLPPPGTGWRFNQAAALNGSDVVLTPAQSNQAGSVFYSSPVNTNGMTASFNLNIGGGTGADGTTFALLDPASAATSVGSLGGGLGFGGLNGVAVAFVTYPQSGVDSHNWVGVATSITGGAPVFAASNTNIPNLRAGSHNAVIRVTGTTIVVSIDGTQVLAVQVATIKPTAIVGFTAATGGATDVHSVSNVQILGGGRTMPAPPTGWTNNGNAISTGAGAIQLTAAAAQQTGSSIYGTAISPARLDANFTVQIGGGTGADGLAFQILDATTATPTSMGSGGGGLGFAGLSGIAVTFITYKQDPYPSNNFVGISTGGTGSLLTFAATTTNVPNLRVGTHAAEVIADGAGHLIVKLDGVEVLNAAVTLPANALIGFSGATGGATDLHAVSAVNIAY